jgi:hypothetical protein
MNRNWCARLSGAALFSMLSLATAPAFAQVDLQGQWQSINQNDAHLRGPGPDLVDYTGLPLNDEGRAAALAFNYSMISMTERMCTDWSQNYISFAPHNIQIERVDDPVSGGIIAWKVSAGGSDRAPMPIFIDGRRRPGPLDLHSFGGFTTGRWEGDVLVGEMTHMKRGLTRRNGAPLSDLGKMTIHLARRGNLLQITTMTEDPIYLEAPVVLTGTYRLNIGGATTATNPPCFPSSEIPSMDAPGTVPHFVPGTNPFVEEFASRVNLPREAIMGGAESMYPEFRKKLEGKYQPPASCARDCR